MNFLTLFFHSREKLLLQPSVNNYLCHFVLCFARILDNLPLVKPIKRPGQDSIYYQQGYHIGIKGQYAGVSSLTKFHKIFLEMCCEV